MHLKYSTAYKKKKIFWKERHRKRKKKEYLKASRKADRNELQANAI